jgi:hypothetical protein
VRITPEPTPVAGRLNNDMPPVETPSAVIVTTDRRAFATTSGSNSSDELTLASTAAGVAAAAAGPVLAVGGRVAASSPTVDAEARTAARTLTPTTERRPREEARRSGVVDADDTGPAMDLVGATGALAAMGVLVATAGADAWIGSAVIFDHSVMEVGSWLVGFGVVTRAKPTGLRRT